MIPRLNRAAIDARQARMARFQIAIRRVMESVGAIEFEIACFGKAPLSYSSSSVLEEGSNCLGYSLKSL